MTTVITADTDFRKVAARMRADLDRADITGRARRLAEFCIKATLGQGRTRVVIPNRTRLCELLKIGKNHVAEVVAALVSARILHVEEIADGWEILIYPDSAMWAVDWFYKQDEMLAFMAMVNQAPGQAQGELVEPAPSLKRALAEVSAELVQSPKSKVQSLPSSQNGNTLRCATGKPPEKPINPAVPKIGTGAGSNLKVKESKDSKAFSFETLKGALYAIEGKDERQAMLGCRQVLGDAVMENDGGKWRLRWRANRAKVHRVFAACVEDMGNRTVRSTGAHTEFLWKQFAD